MSFIDARTRALGVHEHTDPEEFWSKGVSDLLDRNGHLAARGMSLLGLPSLSFDVDGVTGALVTDGESVRVQRTAAEDGPVVALNLDAFSELVDDSVSTFGLAIAGRVDLSRGSVEEFAMWEPVLRALVDGRPVYEPGTVTLRDVDGSALNLRQSFTIGGDDPARAGHFLEQTGFLHLASVFTEDEMLAVSSELDTALAEAERGDGSSWWARTEVDGWYPCRILGFDQRSATLRELLSDQRFQTIGALTDDAYQQRAPHDGDSAEGLWKRVGVVEGPSDVSWHKDCSLGGHSRGCSSLVVGISLTDADATSGELGLVAASRRANIPLTGLHPSNDLPRLALPTSIGDVTVHCSCTLHMSRPPVSAERRVVYTGFDLAPRPGDVAQTRDPAVERKIRAGLGDASRLSEAGHVAERRSARFDFEPDH